MLMIFPGDYLVLGIYLWFVCIILFSFSHLNFTCLCPLFRECSVKSYDSRVCKGKEWKGVLKELLNLLILMRNSKSFYLSQFLKEVLQYRLVTWGVLLGLFDKKEGKWLKTLQVYEKFEERWVIWGDINLFFFFHGTFFLSITLRIWFHRKLEK